MIRHRAFLVFTIPISPPLVGSLYSRAVAEERGDVDPGRPLPPDACAEVAQVMPHRRRFLHMVRASYLLVQMESATELEELDVEGILAFAERVLPSASNLWVQSSLNQKQRLQQLFFLEGVRFDGKMLVGTGLTLPVFNYLAVAEDPKRRVVDQTGIEPVTS